MANQLIQFRIDSETCNKANVICEDIGIDLRTYFRICVARLVKEGGIPFDMKSDKLHDNFKDKKEVETKLSDSNESLVGNSDVDEETPADTPNVTATQDSVGNTNDDFDGVDFDDYFDYPENYGVVCNDETTKDNSN